MGIRTLLAPGVQITEIDKSQYSKSMTGTGCYIQGFTSKGEVYKPMQFTSKQAFENYYGAPDNEAERYSYAAASEVLDNNGSLIFSRLPYDNRSFEKIVGYEYTVNLHRDTNDQLYDTQYSAIHDKDSEINQYATIEGNDCPGAYELSDIENYRSGETKFGYNKILIVDTTGATYGKITEDYRKGEKRELIGIFPVITTAANGLLAQQMISVPDEQVSAYESLFSAKMNTLSGEYDSESFGVDGPVASDFVKRISTQGYYYLQKATFKKAVVWSEEVSKSYDTADLKDCVWHYQNFAGSDLCGQYAECTDDYYTGTQSVVDKTTIKKITITSSNCRSIATMLEFGDAAFVNSSEYTTSDNAVKLAVGSQIWVASAYIATELPSVSWKFKALNNDDILPDSICQEANTAFPAILTATDGEGFDSEHLKDIGVVVYKAYLDPTEGNKISVKMVEAYYGSLCRTDVDPNTGASKFIDNIINNSSEYINFFSNCFTTTADKNWYKDTCDILIATPGYGAMLGFYSSMTKEIISINNSILNGMNKAYDKVSNVNDLQIDVVCDAGMSNIASFIKAIYGDEGYYDLDITDEIGNSLLTLWKCKSSSDLGVKMWKSIVEKMDNFCKNVRKDCMFIADGMRPFVIQGQKKIVRDTQPNNTIDNSIIPYIQVLGGINTSYGAGYCDWFECVDDYTGDFFWCPPSIKAMGVYVKTDVNYNYWDAPAGFTRGVISATDVAFSPTNAQAGQFYSKNWNYAINYPNDGIVLEGQKTFQTKTTALDRINVRRLLLRLERSVRETAKYFIYEPHTAYTRQRLVDAITPYFTAAQNGGGIDKFIIKCDEQNNDAQTIDNNELNLQIGVIPTKTIEWIMADVVVGSHSSDINELLN